MAGSKQHDVLDDGTPINRRTKPRRDEDPPVWYQQMGGWRAFTQLGFAGLVAFLFLTAFTVGLWMFKDAITEQRRQAIEDRQLFREVMASFGAKMDAHAAKLDGLTSEIRASRTSIERSERTIKAATPNHQGEP